MKRMIFVFCIALLSVLLTSCEKITVEPGIINVVFENPRYEGSSFLIDAYITNGLEEDKYIGDVDFALYPQGVETEIAAAMFQINETIKSGEYVLIELEFTSDYVFINEAQFEAYEYEFESIELLFWIYQ
ncbi:MAG: hypothetical protein JXR62_01085 [Bacilli bacterium]|nr:hypothetical protein [Bacilli bacterium]